MLGSLLLGLSGHCGRLRCQLLLLLLLLLCAESAAGLLEPLSEDLMARRRKAELSCAGSINSVRTLETVRPASGISVSVNASLSVCVRARACVCVRACVCHVAAKSGCLRKQECRP